MQISQSKIERYMRILGLKSMIRVKKKLKNKLRSKNVIAVILILLIGMRSLSKKWIVSNWCHHIKYSNKFAYLSILKDVKSKFIVGYKVSEINDNKLYMDTWKAA